MYGKPKSMLGWVYHINERVKGVIVFVILFGFFKVFFNF